MAFETTTSEGKNVVITGCIGFISSNQAQSQVKQGTNLALAGSLHNVKDNKKWVRLLPVTEERGITEKARIAS